MRYRRVFLKYSSERFISVKVSENSKSLLNKSLYICGNKYEFLHLKDDNFYFFATEGTNILPISIDEVRKWHIPDCMFNNNQSIYKRTARYDLMFSSMVPTIKINLNELEIEEDIYNEYCSIYIPLLLYCIIMIVIK